MKKLTILAMITAFVPIANATVSLSIVQPTIGNLNIEVTGTTDQDFYIVLSSNGTLSNYALGTEAPHLSG
ncbi:MAG: hypothetical protein WC962_09360, partial [Phycisphaerae bacterium]